MLCIFFSFRIASIKSFLENSSRPHVFVKDMGFSISEEEYVYIPEGYTHTFLIRHPLRVFASYRKALYDTFSGFGLLPGVDEKAFDLDGEYPFIRSPGLMFMDLYKIWRYVSEKPGAVSVVIDSDDLLSNPAEILPKYCRAVGLPFSESLLKWDASTDVANNWMLPADDLLDSLHIFYKRALKSSEFVAPSPMPAQNQVTPDVIRSVERNIQCYNEMYKARIKI